jgi:hypothetical protein
MVKEVKFLKKQAIKAENAARSSSDAEVSQGFRAMAAAYRSQAALIKKKRKIKKTEGLPNVASSKTAKQK